MKRFNKDSTRVEKRKDREYYKNDFFVEKWVINQKEVTEERQRERERSLAGVSIEQQRGRSRRRRRSKWRR